MRAIGYVALILPLIGCATPQALKEPIDSAASKCVRNGEAITIVEECLSNEGINLEEISYYNDKDVRRYDKCHPSFHLLMTSCAWLHVEVNDQGNITKWDVGDGYDGP